jgi:DNA-binding beta-propeller fold protein YncE
LARRGNFSGGAIARACTPRWLSGSDAIRPWVRISAGTRDDRAGSLLLMEDGALPCRTGMGKAAEAWFELDTEPASVQRIVPPGQGERFEGVAFSPSGDTLAIATSESNSVLLFRRGTDGRFDETPFQVIGKPGLKYPHDVSFSNSDGGELLAVAQRDGAITVYARYGSSDYDPTPAFEIGGPRSKLAFSDGVAFLPPDDRYLAACNLELGTISFFPARSGWPPALARIPELEFKHPSIYHPDGLAFSACGSWLATANHGQHTVTVFRRRTGLFARPRMRLSPHPVTIIKDPLFRHPHSVAFTPATNHLVVTNAGANYFTVYASEQRRLGTRWSQNPVAQVIAHDGDVFKAVNMANKTEGGPKGVAINKNTLAVCSPQIGIKVYSFREGWK